jgi:AcrR family transcriptional regulator
VPKTHRISQISKRRDEILDAATDLFAEHGYAECLTQLLAERVGVGKGTIYRHFPSKRDLFLAAADRVMVRLRERIEGEIAEIRDPIDRWCRAVRSFLEFFADHPDYVELLIQERAQFKDRTRPSYFEHRERNVERWRDVFRALIAAGRIRGIPAERITDVVGDLLYGTIFLNYFAVRESRPENQAENILDVVLFGILSDSERKLRESRPPASRPDSSLRSR